MNARLLRGIRIGLTLVAAAIFSPAASADGLPVVGIDAGPEGVVSEATGDRYVTVPAGGSTVVARIQQDGGRLIRSAVLRGNLVVPVVAYDGTSDGLSPDGRTLVLIRPRATFPRANTTFAILDARQLRVRDRVTLSGDFSFDALSPAGTLLYLIQYVSPKDPSRYLVRAFDARLGRLLPQPIFDSREDLGAAMRGFPVTRATSPDGRWAYTLYDGAGKQPFVHALDTMGRNAVCIDLPALAGREDLYELRLAVSSDGGRVTVEKGDRAVALIDAKTFRVSEPPASQTSVATTRRSIVREAPVAEPPTAVARIGQGHAATESALPWAAVAGLTGGALLGAAFLFALRRRRAGTPATTTNS